MTDVVVRCELKDAAQAAAFHTYLSRFLEGLSDEVSKFADRIEAPFLMVRSEPQPEGDLRVLTFEEAGTAHDFAAGWRTACAAGAASAD